MKKYIPESKKNKMPIFKKNQFENTAWKLNSTVCGIDEVGRGCLAGPLVTAAVILPIGTRYSLLKDSKILSPADRNKAYAWIVKNCQFSIGISNNRTIDTINIWQTTLVTMKKSVLTLLEACPNLPTVILIDAMPLSLSGTKFNTIDVKSFTKGESKSSSIAAASIVAKVTRDRLMCYLDILIPGYSFAEHKGYGTAMHQNAIRSHNHSIIHRISYLNNINNNGVERNAKQQSIC